MKVLVTGAAGFIGMHTCARLLERGDDIVGIDNLNDYYDPRLKRARLAQLEAYPQFRFQRLDIADREGLPHLFAEEGFERVVHLAAQAGVRYSLRNPHAYVESNLVGFINVLEACRQHGAQHLVYASSSSVYGGNVKLPFSEADRVDHPVSLYAATKKANELMAHAYSHLYRLPTTGLRFFTVYGPWGRPDMAPFLFTHAIANGQPIKVFNEGRMRRDFTYIDDVIAGVVAVLDRIPAGDPGFDAADPNPATSEAPYRIFNVGHNESVDLSRFIAAIERSVGRAAIKIMMPIQPGDVEATHASIDALNDWIGFRPSTEIEAGVSRFVEWYRRYSDDNASQ